MKLDRLETQLPDERISQEAVAEEKRHVLLFSKQTYPDFDSKAIRVRRSAPKFLDAETPAPRFRMTAWRIARTMRLKVLRSCVGSSSVWDLIPVSDPQDVPKFHPRAGRKSF